MQTALSLDRDRLSAWLGEVLGGPARLLGVEPLDGRPTGGQAPAAGAGASLLLEVDLEGGRRQLVLRALAADAFGHGQAADRAADLLRERGAAAGLERHVRVLATGAVDDRGLVRGVPDGELFLLTEHAPGSPYRRDLERIGGEDALAAGDRARLLAVADWLVELHALRRPDAGRYRRRLRDLLGRGDGVMGLLDGLPADAFGLAPGRLEQMEQLWVSWRYRLRDLWHRLAQVHGDLHPGNIVFAEGLGFRVLGRCRGEWGEPADDVAALAVHFLRQGLRRHSGLRGPMRELFTLLFERYLERSADREVLQALPPYLAWRALLLAHPAWFPAEPDDVRAALLRFAQNLLASESFDPARVDHLLA